MLDRPVIDSAAKRSKTEATDSEATDVVATASAESAECMDVADLLKQLNQTLLVCQIALQSCVGHAGIEYTLDDASKFCLSQHLGVVTRHAGTLGETKIIAGLDRVDPQLQQELRSKARHLMTLFPRAKSLLADTEQLISSVPLAEIAASDKFARNTIR